MPLYHSRVRVPANTWSITGTVDGQAVGPTFLAAGNYYLDGLSAESLVTAVDNLLESMFVAPNENFTVGYSTTTGNISFACTTLAGTWTISFDQLAFANAMGFATAGGGWVAAGSPQVSAVLPTLQLFTGSGRSAFPGILRATSGATVISESGVTAHIGSNAFRQHSRWEHGFEAYTGTSSPLENGVWAAPATAQWTWRDWWQHHAGTGQPFRYSSAAGLAVTAYEDTYVLDGRSYQEFAPARVEEASDRYWQVRLDVAKYVEAA